MKAKDLITLLPVFRVLAHLTIALVVAILFFAFKDPWVFVVLVSHFFLMDRDGIVMDDPYEYGGYEPQTNQYNGFYRDN